MSLCIICLLLLLKHICAYIRGFISWTEVDRYNTDHCLLFFYRSVSFLPWLMYVQTFCINVKRAPQSMVQSQCLLSSLTDLEPCPLEASAWTSSLLSITAVYTLSSESVFFQSGSSDFPHFAESNLLRAKYFADTSKSLERNFHKLCWTYY